MNQNRIDFAIRKIQGSLAEACAQQHFELMGYKCDFSGIEHIAPNYTSLEQVFKNEKWGNYSFDIRSAFRRIPDFLISRQHPSERETNVDFGSNAKYEYPEALFLEAKFRTDIDLDTFQTELLKQYSDYKNTIIYLVANGWRNWGNGEKTKVLPENNNGHINLRTSENVAIFLNYLARPKWWIAGDKEFDKHIFYAGSKSQLSFNAAYREAIGPTLKEHFKKSTAYV